MEPVSLKDFLFQKSYAEEMVTCLQAYVCEMCYGCQDMSADHSCTRQLNLLMYWHEAKHYFSRYDVMEKLNKRCAMYELEPFTWPELTLALSNVEYKWLAQIQAMVVILTV